MKYRISIVVERWDHTGDGHSPKGWVTDTVTPLTVADAEDAERYKRALENLSVEEKVA